MQTSFNQAYVYVRAILFILAGTLLACANANSTAPTTTALKLVSVFPPAGSTNVSIDTPLRLTFNGPPTLSESGTVQILDDTGAVVDSIDVSARTLSKTIGGLPNFNYYPVVITGNEAVFAFRNNILSYGKTYGARISAGLFVDREGHSIDLNTAKPWRFTRSLKIIRHCRSSFTPITSLPAA